MKEIMLPYVMIVWLLVKAGVIQWNLRNAVITISIGFFIAFSLFTAHRLWSPADLTDSTTIKAPHAVISPLIGQEVERVFVIHNQRVKKGDVLYTLVSVDSSEELRNLEAQREEIEADIVSTEVHLKREQKNLERVEKLKNYASQMNRDDLLASVDTDKSEIKSNKARIRSLDARIKSASWQNERRAIRAPFDGQLTISNLAEGTRVGNMQLYDTNRKFLEMRIADQAYRYIEPGQFAEFYVNAYPGEIFRGRVHSITAATGEAMVSVASGDQQVRQHVGNNAGSLGRTVVIEFDEPEGYTLPLGATGSAWISARKPHPMLGFIDIIGAGTVRLKAYKAYLAAM